MEKQCFYLFILFEEIFLIFYKVIESSVFQLNPLSKSYKYDISMNAIECSTTAIDILHSIYQKAEYCLQNCGFFYITFQSFLKQFFLFHRLSIVF